MGFAQRLLYPALNATWGASLGTCAALVAYQTLRGGAVVAGSAAAVYAGWALAIMAPAWLIVWIAAGLAGFVTGLLRPLPR